MKSIARHFLLVAVVAAGACQAHAGPADDVAATATAFFNAQNAHDLETVSSIMANSEDFLLVRGPALVWGHDAVVKQYAELYKGVWAVKTDGKPPKVVMFNDTAAETFVPVTFTVGPREGETKEFALNVTQIWVRNGGNWQIQSILATPVKPL
ncbi:YybH family protein [Gellertiella hungarica]|uniref:Uncharacterized protein (TIGR02246 family) n=1 Tax=Gellertiella hungarica TaxID=1572859 RepID=A0A7W6J3G5_9HYPH|nr:nuclear transport factor 2 family protein [Gellertiella hungarica]MBB4063392.1 uncharacterized protein (TIGR02246 family) [Gellertiella hungarica]